MFAKTVDGVYVNLLGADTITREDNKSGSSRFVIRHGQVITSIGVLPHDKLGTPRRKPFEIVERFLEKFEFLPESMTATMVQPSAHPASDPCDAYVRIEDLVRERDSSRDREGRLEQEVADLKYQLGNYTRAIDLNIKAISDLEAELAPYRRRQAQIDASTGSDPGDDPDNVGY